MFFFQAEDGIRDLVRSRGLGDVYKRQVVTQKLGPEQTYCSLCSRLRRGILYSAAERLGANKIALGHHREDALETFLLNLLYAGRLQTLPPKYRTDDGRFEVIRPLIECAETDIAAYAAERKFPILPCGLCGSQEGLRRDAMGELLSQLEQDNPSCLLYTSPSPRDRTRSRMPSSA